MKKRVKLWLKSARADGNITRGLHAVFCGECDLHRPARASLTLRPLLEAAASRHLGAKGHEARALSGDGVGRFLEEKGFSVVSQLVSQACFKSGFLVGIMKACIWLADK